MEPILSILIFIGTIVGGLTVFVLFFLTISKTLRLINYDNRLMGPNQVWLVLIPLFNLYWFFVIARNLCFSIRNEFRSRGLPVKSRPTFALGYSWALLSFASVALGWRALVHSPQWLISLSNLATIIVWIAYWANVSDYKKRLQQLPQHEEDSLIFGNMNTKA